MEGKVDISRILSNLGESLEAQCLDIPRGPLQLATVADHV